MLVSLKQTHFVTTNYFDELVVTPDGKNYLENMIPIDKSLTDSHDPQCFITYNNKDRSYEKIMGNVRLNIEYDLMLKKSKISSGFKHNERESNSVLYPTDHIHFVICNSCYWCASYFSVNDLESSSLISRLSYL
jgi:hypothetical protein